MSEYAHRLKQESGGDSLSDWRRARRRAYNARPTVRRAIFLLALVFVVSATLPGVDVLASQGWQPETGLPYETSLDAPVAEQLVVLYTAAETDAAARGNEATFDGDVVADVAEAKHLSAGVDVVVPDEGVDVTALAAELEADPQVAAVFPNRALKLYEAPNDYAFSSEALTRYQNTRYASQYVVPTRANSWFTGAWPQFPLAWQYAALGNQNAWGTASGSPVVVGVIDTGVNRSHPDLAGRLETGKNYEDNNTNVVDPDGHGTQVALSLAGVAGNSWGSAGAAGRTPVKIKPYSVWGDTGFGSQDLVVSHVMAALDDISRDSSVRIVNMSFGVDGTANLWRPGSGDVFLQSLWQKCETLKNQGKLLIAAAGNGVPVRGVWHYNYYSYPAGFDNVLGIGALDYMYSGVPAGVGDATYRTTRNTTPTLRYSSYSQYNSRVDFCAPGSRIAMNSGDRGLRLAANTLTFNDGTSFAAPIFAGTAAAILTQCPQLTGVGLTNLLKATARDLQYNPSLGGVWGASGGEDSAWAGRDNHYGNGIPQVDDTFEALRNPANTTHNLTVRFVDQDGKALAGVPSLTTTVKDYSVYTGYHNKSVAWHRFGSWRDSTGNVGTGTSYVMPARDVTLTVVYPDTRPTLASMTVTGLKNVTYTGKTRRPTFKIAYGGKYYTVGRDFTATYASNKAVGTATIRLTANNTTTRGSRTLSFKILPTKTKITKLTAGRKKLTMKWKKISGTTKYQVRYKRASAGWKTKTVSAKKRSVTLQKLAARKTYKLQIRSYKTVKGKKFYSTWSTLKSKKTK
ncbi:MAG: S8/S53 family peptidase [Actinomycetes bacterium]|jgi:subtilisin family serine protease|nr:S8/S53 family peptidase [Actinomycetes bacterium]